MEPVDECHQDSLIMLSFYLHVNISQLQTKSLATNLTEPSFLGSIQTISGKNAVWPSLGHGFIPALATLQVGLYD